MRSLASYHAAWLVQKLGEGFEVHHLDGNPQNDDPLNLVLIEGEDHMRLHSLPFPAACHAGRKGGRARLTKMTAAERSRIARKGGKARWARTADPSAVGARR